MRFGRTRILPERVSTTLSRTGKIILGDLIVVAAGKPVSNVNDLFRVIDSHEVGDTLRLTILRAGNKTEVELQLQALP